MRELAVSYCCPPPPISLSLCQVYCLSRCVAQVHRAKEKMSARTEDYWAERGRTREQAREGLRRDDACGRGRGWAKQHARGGWKRNRGWVRAEYLSPKVGKREKEGSWNVRMADVKLGRVLVFQRHVASGHIGASQPAWLLALMDLSPMKLSVPLWKPPIPVGHHHTLCQGLQQINFALSRNPSICLTRSYCWATSSHNSTLYYSGRERKCSPHLHCPCCAKFIDLHRISSLVITSRQSPWVSWDLQVVYTSIIRLLPHN